VAGDVIEPAAAHLLPKRGHDRRRSRVRRHHAVAQDLAAGADGRKCLALAGDADRADRIVPAGRSRFGNRGHAVVAHPGRIDLGPARLGRQERILPVGHGQEVPALAEHAGLAAGGADVESEVAHGNVGFWMLDVGCRTTSVPLCLCAYVPLPLLLHHGGKHNVPPTRCTMLPLMKPASSLNRKPTARATTRPKMRSMRARATAIGRPIRRIGSFLATSA